MDCEYEKKAWDKDRKWSVVRKIKSGYIIYVILSKKNLAFKIAIISLNIKLICALEFYFKISKEIKSSIIVTTKQLEKFTKDSISKKK